MADPKIDALSKFLDRLVPPKEVVVRDLSGAEVRVPSSISARRNVVVMREMQALLALPAVDRSMRAIGEFVDDALSPENVGSAVVRAVGICADPEVIDRLSTAFAEAHPEVLQGARSRAGRPEADAADLFSVEELTAALLPLFVGLVRRSVEALRAVGGAG